MELNGKNILIIDDDEDMRNILDRICSNVAM
jgi:hypothetical protein